LIFGSFDQGKEQRLQIAKVGIMVYRDQFFSHYRVSIQKSESTLFKNQVVVTTKISVVILKLFI
jgi:hypothetical protein